MIKSLFFVAVGAIGALEAEKRLGAVRDRLRPRAVTDAVFDKMNQRLEQSRKPGA
jgi:hypothetical protein